MTKTRKPRQSKKLSKLIENIKEIATGVTVEKLSAMYFDESRLKQQPKPMYRLDSNNHRYYYTFDDLGEPTFFTSVTTLIKNTLPTSPYLIKWLIDKGGDNGKDEAEERAHYGTFLHGECASLLIKGTYDLDKLASLLKIYLEVHHIPQDRIKWADELKKDVLAFAQFMIDYNVKPLAIELILSHPTDGYAGAIDLVCEHDLEEKGRFGETYASGANKGQPKESRRMIRVISIIDIKSGRKGFYESHEIQLQAYKEMFNIHFPDVNIDKIWNWSPKEWRSTPSYNFKDQTDSRSIAKLPYLVELAKLEDAKRDNSLTVLSGMVDLLKGTGQNIEVLTFIELIKRNK